MSLWLCHCNVYDEHAFDGASSKDVSAVQGVMTERPTQGDSGTQQGASEAGGSSTPNSDGARTARTATGACALGSCWWSDPEATCGSVGAPTSDDRPQSAESPDDTPADAGDIFLGWSELRFGAAKPSEGGDLAMTAQDGSWQRLGVDLDGACTQSSSCPDHRDVSCKPVADQTAFDGEQCRDNSMGTVLAIAERLPEVGPRFGLTESSLNCGLRRGSYNVLTRIRGYNGQPDDPEVRVDWYASGGLEQLPDWSCDPSKPDLPQSYPLWRASAAWTIDARLGSEADGSDGANAKMNTGAGLNMNMDMDIDKAAQMPLPDSHVFDAHAYVRGGYLVSRLPDGATLRLAADGEPFHGLALRVSQALWLGRLHKGQDNTWNIQDGMTAGRVTTDDVMRAFRHTGFCSGEGFDTLYRSIYTYVSESADVLANGDNDPGTTCDALSYALGFSAAQVTPGKLADLPELVECCPPGLRGQRCARVCGDGELGPSEICDTAIAAGKPGACPTACGSDDPCVHSVLMGEGCEARCVDQPVTGFIGGDLCCPEGATAAQDPDCVASCGNGIVEAGETCDPQESCGECTSEDPCLTSRVEGSAATCTAKCVWTTIANCVSGDKCCPHGCQGDQDSDCSASCGDGKIDAEAGETCEAQSENPCPDSCDDGEACTQDIQTGSPENCNVRCSHVAITLRDSGDGCCPPGANAQTDTDCQSQCGNGVKELGEDCDDGNTKSGDGCDASCRREASLDQCLAIVPEEDDACARCVCEQCGPQTTACYASDAKEDNKLCSDVVACIRNEHCQGAECYCGPDLLPCSLGMPRGACRRQIEAASRTSSVTGVSARANDTAFPIGRASALGECTWDRCAQACKL